MATVELTGIGKVYEGGVRAVRGVDLSVGDGEFVVLVGPSGCGKSTTLRMVAGLLRPDSGAISIFGVDALTRPVEAKRITAWVSDEPMIYDKLTPLEYLEFVAGLWSVEAAEAQAAEDVQAVEVEEP